MILVFGGTTEGRSSVMTLEEAGNPFWYSTRGDSQQISSLNGKRLCGAMTAEAMRSFCTSENIRLIVDAAHPFAEHLHATIAATAEQCRIPVIRYERTYPRPDPAGILCDSYEDAVDRMEQDGIRDLLALTGVQTISRLAGFWKKEKNHCRFRILDTEESRAKARSCGFPEDRLTWYRSPDNTSALLEQYHPQAVITKESGLSGGFPEKEAACLEHGIRLYIIRRPALPENFITVTGPFGLRRKIEQILPDFFPLHTGFTTGSCAAAAAKAAIIALTEGHCPETVTFRLPDGEEMSMETAVLECTGNSATARTIKEAGDDPDVTDQTEIRVKVTLTDRSGIRFLQGEGVGTVTLPGIGIPVGDPAVNAVPRKMIEQEIRSRYSGGAEVTVSVPGGEELAARTFNPRLGITGGISIIGTSGIVRPFSAEAFVQAIRKEMEVALATGAERLVLNSGAKSEHYVKKHYPELNRQAFIHYGNYIGDCLETAHGLGVRKVSLGIMIGKAVKLAAGHLDTHSRNVTMDREFLLRTAREAGCSAAAEEKIRSITLARELWTLLSSEDIRKFAGSIAAECHRHCRKAFPSGELTLLLIDEDGNIRKIVE